MLKYFAEKMWVAKATHIFSAKNIKILYIDSAKIFNEMTLNELVKLTMLWTTGPWLTGQKAKLIIFYIRIGQKNEKNPKSMKNFFKQHPKYVLKFFFFINDGQKTPNKWTSLKKIIYIFQEMHFIHKINLGM